MKAIKKDLSIMHMHRFAININNNAKKLNKQ